MAKENRYTDFDEYIRQGEPRRKEKAVLWEIAIGLQDVDGLSTSDYLRQTARQHIEDEITVDEARERVTRYYVSKSAHDAGDDDKEEADRVSANIVKVLSSQTFDFSTGGYLSLHRRVFQGVMKHAGELRTYDITKKEWVLEGDTVLYLNWEDLRRALDYDLEQERTYNYSDKNPDEMIRHLSRFVSGLWQIHAFGEGNTRTTAVFTIQYLRSLGFKVDNESFARHSWYFRNALVRANYRNVAEGIEYTPVYLERFFRNLLLGEQWDLRNRYLHIHPTTEWSVQPNLGGTPVSTRQVPDKYPTSTGMEPDGLHTNNPNIERLVQLIGRREVSVREMMKLAGLKNRENFLELYLTPAITEGYVQMLYPHSPRHPRQKYLLTVKGVLLNDKLQSMMMP